VHGDTALLELLTGTAAEVVAAERGEEVSRPVEVRELNRGHGAATGRLLPGLERVDDLTRLRHLLDPRELHPLHVPDDGDVHISHLRVGVRFKGR
jgi:hypothetical protein